MIPEGWENQKLNDIGTIITGNTPKTSIVDYYKNGSKLCSGGVHYFYIIRQIFCKFFITFL